MAQFEAGIDNVSSSIPTPKTSNNRYYQAACKQDIAKQQSKPQTSSAERMTLRGLLYHPGIRAIFFQTILILCVGTFFYTVVNNALENLERRGIATGFDFMSQTAGFDIGMSLIEYDATFTYAHTFVVGLLNTALVAVLGIFFATILGFSLGVARLSNNWLLSRLSVVYVEIFRNIPLLLQILFWYIVVLQALPSARQSYAFADAIFLNVRGLYLPLLVFETGSQAVIIAFLTSFVAAIGIHLFAQKKQRVSGVQIKTWRYSLAVMVVLPSIAYLLIGQSISIEYPALKGFNFQGGIAVIPELFALLIALCIYTAAFIAEIVRSGISAVDHGQTEAAESIGMKKSHTLRLIIIPQALRVIIPPLTSQYLNLVKNSSLAMAIGYPDLVSVFAGTTLNQTGQAIEIIAMTMGVYLTLSLLTSFLMNIYNRKIALVER
jgi:general L-amino acid transport system permease protein